VQAASTIDSTASRIRRDMLHVTNGESTLVTLARSGVPGRFSSWDDILHDGPTPLVSGDEWVRVRAQYFASVGYGEAADMARDFKIKDDALEALRGEDEVVFWFEHDLYDQLLLIRHLWWIGRHREAARRFSIVIGSDYLGMLTPADFPPRFERREAITDEQIALGTEAWTAYCGDDPTRLVAFADVGHLPPEGGSRLPYLGRAIRRLLEEFPSAKNGLSRTERQILDVLAEGDRSPEQTFVAASKLEDDIWLGDWSFWTTVQRIGAGPHPLVRMDVTPREDRLPSGTLSITDAGRRVRGGHADHITLNAPSRWIGGTRLQSDRQWRWTGLSFI
jgi:hypothetical protein